MEAPAIRPPRTNAASTWKVALSLLGFGVGALPPADGDGPESGIFPSPRVAEPASLSGFRSEVRCDIQALGATVQRLATGCDLDWDADDGGTASRATRSTPREPASLAQRFSALTRRCLHLPLAGGYEHAGQLKRDLATLERLASAPEHANAAAPVTSVDPPARRGAPRTSPPAKVIVRCG
jgi:hypothetical protein